MEYAYRYIARASSGHSVDGVVFASDDMHAAMKVKQIGHQPIDLHLDVLATMSSLWIKEFNQAELARFYISLGKKLEHGGSVGTGVQEAMEFVNDTKLLTALGIMRDAVREGAKVGQAMAMAGFDQREVAAISALEKVGQQGATFISLGEEVERRRRLKQMMKKTMRTPKFFMALVYAMTYGTLVWAAPKVEKLLKSMPNVDLPPFAKAYYRLADLFQAHLLLATSAYLAIGIGTVFLLRSPAFRSLLNSFPTIRRLDERSDQASLWGGFAVLYEAGQAMDASAKMLAKASYRPESRRWFDELGALIHAGVKLEEAVARAGFPAYVCNAVRAGVSSGDISHGLERLTKQLMEEVTDLSEGLSTYIEYGMYILMGVALLIYFMITYYPILQATMAQI